MTPPGRPRWCLNPPEVREDYEVVTPPVADRIEAMRRCTTAGYPIRVMLMPIISTVERSAG
jgi:DNA repair photolyase